MKSPGQAIQTFQPTIHNVCSPFVACCRRLFFCGVVKRAEHLPNFAAHAWTQQRLKWSNEVSNTQHRWKQKKCSVLQHLLSEHFWSRANFIQQENTTHNMSEQDGQTIQTFSTQQIFCMLFYEKFASFKEVAEAAWEVKKNSKIWKPKNHLFCD